MTDGVRLDKVRLTLGQASLGWRLPPWRATEATEAGSPRQAPAKTTFHFDITLAAGAVTAIMGPSGAGKSTFLNLVAGFERPDTGRIEILGEDVTQKHPAQRPVSLVFQDNNLFAHLDIATNIGLGIDPALRLSKDDRLGIAAALERVGLAGFERRRPGTLSGGERQRAAFARALVRRRPLLLMDEPFAALDRDLRQAMASLLVDLHRETGNTVLIVSHDRQDVDRMADAVVTIDKGQIDGASTVLPRAAHE